MAGKWRVLLPHFLAMLVIYVIGVSFVAIVFGRSGFLISLAIALAIALLYPTATRRLDVAPEPWQRE